MKYLRNIPMEERFWNKVEKTDDCWNWVAHQNGDGYGIFNWQRKTYRAHRISFYLTHGHFPLICRHVCDNPSCVRPDHLEDGNSYDNAIDRSKRGRHFSKRKPIVQQDICYLGTIFTCRPKDTGIAVHAEPKQTKDLRKNCEDCDIHHC